MELWDGVAFDRVKDAEIREGIAGLFNLVEEQDARIQQLEAENERLRAENRRLTGVLTAQLPAHVPPTEAFQASTEPASLTGAQGVALSDLRPGGFARITGQRVDVVTQGDYISAGEPIEVLSDEGYRRVVRRLERGEEEGDQDKVGE